MHGSRYIKILNMLIKIINYYLSQNVYEYIKYCFNKNNYEIMNVVENYFVFALEKYTKTEI